MKKLIDIVMHPKKYTHVIGVPGQFDAAEYLLNNHWEELTEKQASRVEDVLVRSGRYEKQ
jgi:hypothetical protein